jgi:outer membrane protein assembly complex protein YaeT
VTVRFSVDAGVRARIGEITVTGEVPEGNARLLSDLHLASGQPWDATRVNERKERSIERLKSRGYYQAALTVRSQPRPDSRTVDVAVDLQTGPLVELVFEGDPLPRERIDALVPVKREGSADEDLLEDSKRRIEEYLQNQGYWKAAVEYRRTEAAGRLRVVFTIAHGQRYLVADVEFAGVSAVPVADIRALTSTRAGAPFRQRTLDADVAAITQWYRERGYADAKASASVEASEPPADRQSEAGAAFLLVRVTVDEGRVTRVGTVTLQGAHAVQASVLEGELKLKAGAPFYRPQLAADRSALVRAYQNRGYREVAVSVQTLPDSDRQTIDIVYRIDEGVQALVDHVIVVGNTRTKTETIERAIQLKPGDPVALDALFEAQRRLTILGLFRRVRIEDRALPGESARDIVVAVDEAPATTLSYGGGFEASRRLLREADGTAVESIDVAPRAFVDIGRRNLWGKNRSVNLFSRASFRRSNASTATNQEGTFGFNEYRVVGSYREPRVFGWNADGQISAYIEQEIQTSFSYRRNGINADLTRRLSGDLTLIGRYTYDNTSLFDEQFNPSDQPLIDRLFPQVRLSIVSGTLARDTRDDPLDPTRGTFTTMTGSLAARALGGEVGFVRSYGEAFYYRRLPTSRRLVVVTGARLGLAGGFAREVTTTGPGGEPITTTVDDLPASERFYAGGGTTVRGFSQDRLGAEGTIDQDGFPTGGNAVLIANNELRFPIWRSVGGVAFLDAGNVFLKASTIDLGEIRGAVGFGLRYRSPVGPLRVDIGFKLDRQVSANGTRERGYVVHIGLGQAF